MESTNASTSVSLISISNTSTSAKLLEQDGLALHDRLGRKGADIAEAEHGGAIGNDGHKIGARGIEWGVRSVLGDLEAGVRHARRIGQRQVSLIGERLSGLNGELAGLWVAMEV